MAQRQSFRHRHVSKFKHVFGNPAKKEGCYEGINISQIAWESNFCAVNPKFLAVALESSCGGPFLVLPLSQTGKIDPFNQPKVNGHTRPVLDLGWNPFDDNVIASASEDCSIKIWYIPDCGLCEDLNREDFIGHLQGHDRKVGIIRWHPCASNIIASAGFDDVIIIWDVEREAAVLILKGHPDTIFSLSFNWNGSLIATTCKDKKIRVIDPREGRLIASGEGHKGPKCSQVVFLGNTSRLFSTGFSRTQEREVAVWDLGNALKRPLNIEQLDSSSGNIMLYYDHDTHMVYLAGKGDGNIRYYEVLEEEPYFMFLNEFRSASPQRGLGVMPKRGLEVHKCEIMRFYKLQNNGVVEPIAMTVPRRHSGTYQFDLFPKTPSNKPAMSAEQWIMGSNKAPLMDELLPGLTVDGMSREAYESSKREDETKQKENKTGSKFTRLLLFLHYIILLL
ncbi:predicted protein [Nematostella vectensis]|uniref:Coronin n=1 Tax=Nematostella vectensis TaxID=45351 RepID=A7S473_NEMVE|nr:predicted protein [Nematostella vectensis]|eukprot:XP_001633530.1 predicted protein [Nematostella vectensis]